MHCGCGSDHVGRQDIDQYLMLSNACVCVDYVRKYMVVQTRPN